ncbi:MAG: hypothetical protein ACOYKZ_03965, partial [Chlamydiia bacterium]
ATKSSILNEAQGLREEDETKLRDLERKMIGLMAGKKREASSLGRPLDSTCRIFLAKAGVSAAAVAQRRS